MKKSKENFYQILEENKQIIYKICHTYCKNAEDKNDLSQEIVLQIWRSMHRYDPAYKMSTWIYRIALNTAISFYRKYKNDDLKSDSVVEEIIEWRAFENSFENPIIDQLYEFINELNSMNKALILLYLEDYDHSTIAEILGLSQSNVGTKINRIKNALKLRFETEMKAE